MSEEQARQRAQELTKKALAEAENETFDMSVWVSVLFIVNRKINTHSIIYKILFCKITDKFYLFFP